MQCLLAAAILFITLLAYQPVWHAGFVWDDDSWTTRRPWLLRGLSGLLTMWCKPTALQQYYPLTATTFWLDYHLWGLWTLPYHVENVLLHAFAALLFWRLLRRLEVPGDWLAAAIFALHPVMVESAGWITERKNVLSLVLYLGALLAYGRWTSFWKGDKDPPPGRAYLFALLLGLAALLAKTTALSLPAVILLICWWQRGRIQWRADVRPALPFFAVAVGLSLVTAWLEKHHVGAQGSEWAISFPQRCLIAGRALWFYTGKLLWPVNLCFIYPQWQLNASSISQWLYPITAVGVLFALWLARRKIGRGPATAAFFFVGTVFPSLGFMNAYFMRYSFVCDHWTYLSSLGLIAFGAALVGRAAEHLRARPALYGFAAVILPTLMILTWRQAHIYRDPETLWRDTLTKNPQCWLAHNSLGSDLYKSGKVTEAVEHFEEALRYNPDYAEAHNNMAIFLFQKGDVQGAMSHWEHALRSMPDYAAAHISLGIALLTSGKAPEAIGHFEQALLIWPDFPDLHCWLADALAKVGKPQEAIGHYEKALKLGPDSVRAVYGLARLLATLSPAEGGDLIRAISLAQRACQLTGNKSAECADTLATAYAAAGQSNEAITVAEAAIDLARSAGRTQLVGQIELRLEHYRAGEPYR